MVIGRSQSALAAVEESWKFKVSELDPVAQELLEPPAWRLSGILLETVHSGEGEVEESALMVCRALELLEQALRLGRATGADPDGYIETNLLITDYLYAHAIDQVIAINKPVVIGLLATAIMTTAEDRVTGDFDDHRRRLTTAAADIGAYLLSLKSRAVQG